MGSGLIYIYSQSIYWMKIDLNCHLCTQNNIEFYKSLTKVYKHIMLYELLSLWDKQIIKGIIASLAGNSFAQVE